MQVKICDFNAAFHNRHTIHNSSILLANLLIIFLYFGPRVFHYSAGSMCSMKANPSRGRSPFNRMVGRKCGFAMKHIKPTTVLALFMMTTLVGSMVAFNAIPVQAQSTLDQNQYQLAVISASSKLPADSGQYPLWIQLQTLGDSSPIQAPRDIMIALSSSDDSVAITPGQIAIKKGESIVTATIQTTSTPGVVEVTAITEGVAFGKTQINTVRPDSLEPSILAIGAGSGKFIPNPSLPGKVYVQLLNSANVPAITKEQLTVYLSSSDPKIGTLSSFIRIPAGSSGALVTFTPTFQYGTIKLTASANGFTPGEVQVRTVGPAGSKLVLEMAPANKIPAGGYYSFFTVQIRDSNDMPVKAHRPITVTLSSSNTNVVETYSQITIPAGSSYAIERIYSKSNPGSATLTAIAQGFSSGSVNIITESVVWGDPGASKKIKVFTIPSTIIPDGKESTHVIVQVTDSADRPYTYRHYFYNGIKLYSSDPKVGIVSEHLISEATFAVGSARSSSQGTTTITASNSGYSSGSAKLESNGPLPEALSVAQLHNVVLADNAAKASAIVGLIDGDGNPTFAQKDVIIALSSSNQEVATVESSEFILAGQSYALIEVYPTTKTGTTTITASAEGLAASSIQFKTVGSTGDSSSYKLAIRTVPELLADGRAYEAVVVQLQNAAGNPVPAKSDIRVSLSSSSASAGSVQDNVTVKAGSSFAVASLTPTMTPSNFKISASSTGYATVSTDVVTSAQPVTIVRTSELPRSAPFEPMLVAVDVSSGGLPLQNATVMVGGPDSKATQAITDESGHAESMYVPTEPGRKQIAVTVSKPGYKLTTEIYWITLEQTVSIYAEARTEAGKSIPVEVKIAGDKGTKTIRTKAGSPSGLDDAQWGTYKTSVPEEFSTVGARYQFTSWADGVKENPRTDTIIHDRGFVAIYSAEYLVTATTETGTVIGTGYYPEGEIANISISTTAIQGFPTDKSFAAWSGDVQIASANAQFLVDEPKTIKAEWSTSYLKLIAILGAVGGGGFAAYYKVIKPKKEAKEKARAPDLDWYKE